MFDPVRKNILELCSESEYGSWEFWLTKPEERNLQQADEILNALIELTENNKIFPMEEEAVANRSYLPTNLDKLRLQQEIYSSMNPNNEKLKKYYWFLATEEGKRMDLNLRTK
jgi:hypothetical protein